MFVFDTAIGPVGLRWGPAGLSGVEIRTRAPLSAGAPPEPARAAVAGIVALLDGAPRDLRELALDEEGLEPFQRRVYAAARAVGPGETTTYGGLARAVGEPGAARAVGAALGANPYPIVVPCHRVLAADGALHGFSAPGGIATKRRMLEIEGAPGFTQVSLFA